VLEHHPGQERVPHRRHRIVIASLPAHDLQVLHQPRVWEMIAHQVEAIQIAARFNIAPVK
jgi:hypothetical protein